MIVSVEGERSERTSSHSSATAIPATKPGGGARTLREHYISFPRLTFLALGCSKGDKSRAKVGTHDRHLRSDRRFLQKHCRRR